MDRVIKVKKILSSKNLISFFKQYIITLQFSSNYSRIKNVKTRIKYTKIKVRGSDFLDIQKQIEALGIAKEKIQYQEPMKKHTTFKIGGPAEYFISIEKQEELKKILAMANENNVPITVIGNGSNLLVLDQGIKGITLKIKIEKIEIQEKENEVQITVGAGEKLGKLARNLFKRRNNRTRRAIWHTRNNRRSYSNECWSPWEGNERHRKNCKMHGLSRK